jgi:hypothetical protein
VQPAPIGQDRLVAVAKELDDRAHSVDPTQIHMLSTDAKSVLGVFADFVQANRAVLLNTGVLNNTDGSSAEPEHGSGGEQTVKQDLDPSQVKLL